ncbi:hypothetical protein EFE01_00790 [Latilactobacillus curvatus]|nr:hypothetical protein [Latilactobacillus curvatus]
MDCVVTPLKTLMGFSVHLNVQLKFYNLPKPKKERGTKLVLSPASMLGQSALLRVFDRSCFANHSHLNVARILELVLNLILHITC